MKRKVMILSPTDIGASGTRVEDLNVTGFMSALYVVFKFTAGTASVMTAPILRCLSKIEIVDGAEVLFSCSGEEAEGVYMTMFKRAPYKLITLAGSGSMIGVVPIMFGRWLWDTDLALYMSRYKNPQIRITFDEDAANGSVTANELAIVADVMDEQEANPKGFLLTREHKEYAMSASTHEYTDLPTDYPIRYIGLRGYSEDHDPVSLFSNIKLSVDNDRLVPLDVEADTYFETIFSQLKRYSYKITGDDAVTAKTIYTPLSKDVECILNYDNTAFVTAQSKFAEATYTGPKIVLSASADIKAVTALVSGLLPHEIIPIFFGDTHDPTDWLNPSGFKNFKADIQSSSDADSGDTCSLITQQLKLY